MKETLQCHPDTSFKKELSPLGLVQRDERLELLKLKNAEETCVGGWRLLRPPAKARCRCFWGKGMMENLQTGLAN